MLLQDIGRRTHHQSASDLAFRQSWKFGGIIHGIATEITNRVPFEGLVAGMDILSGGASS